MLSFAGGQVKHLGSWNVSESDIKSLDARTIVGLVTEIPTLSFKGYLFF